MLDVVKNEFIIRAAIAVPLKELINKKLATKIWTYSLDASLSWELRKKLLESVESAKEFKNSVVCNGLTAEILRIDPSTGSVNRSINDFILVHSDIRQTLATSIYVVFHVNDVNQNLFALTLVGREEGSILGFISAEKEEVAMSSLKKMLQKNATVKSKSKK